MTMLRSIYGVYVTAGILTLSSLMAHGADKLGAAADAQERARFEMVCGVEPATIVLAKSEHPGVLAAAKDLQRDVTKITGVTPNIVYSLDACGDVCVVLGSADCPDGKKLLASVGVSTEDLDGKWETFKYRVLNGVGGKRQVLAIAGSNVRGAIFGIYDFEQKHMGVDPLWFWADHEPPTQGELIFDDSVDFGPTKEPTWKYRGWTLNDHPQFIEWMESGLVQRARYGRYMFAIHPEVFARLHEAALRLKMNMFTWYFIDIDWHPDYEQLRSTVDRGLFITQHQMESVGADTGFWEHYWKNRNPAGQPEEFSYLKHPEAFQEFWSYYIRRWSEFSPNVVWELNLRGWADAAYSEPTLPDGGTDQQRAEILSKAMADQARLVRQIDPNPDVEMMTTLYAEVGRFYDEGWITVPEGVTTGFGDAGMAGMSYSKKFWTETRDPKRKYGQYFHTQYFGGGPQIAKCTPVEQYLKVNIDAMHQRGDTQHMLLAMNELRHQQIEIRGIAEMLWDYPSFDAREYMLRYCREEFGPEVAERVLALYDAYYEKYPHIVRDDGFKVYPVYSKVLEPAFTVVGNLLNIESGNTDGFVLNYRYDKAVYEQGIRDLGGVLEQAIALRPKIPEGRQYFFDYEFIDAIRQVRGIYRICIAANEAIARLEKSDRAGALAELLAAQPLVEELYAGYKNNCAGEKWRYWYRSGTNEDFYLLYNLYQKARLRLEVESMDFADRIEPQRHPYLGNVVMHVPATAGDCVYSSQAERINGSVFNGAPFSILSFPLQDAFQIGGVQSTYRKWKLPVPDYGLSYSFRLHGPATVYVAKPKDTELPWLTEAGFEREEATMDVGRWGWPYRYRNRPPQTVYTFELYAKQFSAGEVKLGPNSEQHNDLPYIVFIRPVLHAYENFKSVAVGQMPAGWKIERNGGLAEVVANPDYEGDMRASVFDISTVRRYQPLGLKSFRLAATESSNAPLIAVLPFRKPIEEDARVNLRVKPGQGNATTGFSLQDGQGKVALTVEFSDNGRIACRTGGGEMVDVAPYEAGRWYNLLLYLSPGKGRFDLTVEDDHANPTVQKDLALGAGNPTSIRLEHDNGRPGSHVMYDAIDAWQAAR